jgi:hypothetical protein
MKTSLTIVLAVAVLMIGTATPILSPAVAESPVSDYPTHRW